MNEAQHDTGSFWLSYADLLSGMLLVVLLLLGLQLLQQQQQQQQMLGVEAQLIERLRQRFAGTAVEVLSSGQIRIGEGILFDRNDSQLKSQGKESLRKIIPEYAAELFEDPQLASEIERVTVEGHASADGNERYNMRLSQERAFSVYRFIFDDLTEFKHREQFLRVLESVGRGKNAPIEGHDAVASANRRVELKFQLRWKQRFQEVFGGER